MADTQFRRAKCAHPHRNRTRGRRLASSIEQLETRWLMAADVLVSHADVPENFVSQIVASPTVGESGDPVAEPAILVPGGSNNTTAESLLAAGGPGDPSLPGFNNVARSGDGGTVVYLGAGWALTANHVSVPSTITWAGRAYSVDTSSIKRLTNPDGSNTDLKMFKVLGDPPLPELFGSYIASAPATGHVFMVGNGYTATREQYWSVNKSTMPWTWTEISEPANPTYSNYAGVNVSGPRVIRWGENVVQDSGLYMPIGGVYVAGFSTRFDRQPYTNQPALANEAQAATGDSGGAVFSQENGRWVLSGIMLAVSGSMSGQPANTTMYGSITVIADLSVYRTQILSIAGVVNRQLVYNNSAFDGNTPEIGEREEAALATDKRAYLPGSGVSTFDNVSNYTRGINSIVVDIASVHGELTAKDFTFKLGTNDATSSWIEAPAPTTISVRPGAGEGGSDRVHIIWPDGVIFATWLEVTVKGNDAQGGFNTNTGLAKTDVFYFGHRPGDAGGNGSAAAVTGAFDELAARNNPGVNEPIDTSHDFDKNRIVGAADALFARANAGILVMLDLPATAVAISLAAEEPASQEIPTVGELIELPKLEPNRLLASLLSAREAVFAAIANSPVPTRGIFAAGPLDAILRKR